jgi:ABC-type multidrug transport system fused ATPase/permease subunit
MISLTYIMSFFLDESSSQNMVLLVNFVIGNMGAIIVRVLRMSSNSAKIFGKIIEYILAFIPSFCFDFALNILLNLNEVLWIEHPNEYFSIETNQVIKKFNLLLSMIIYSSIECFLYFILLIIVQKRALVIKKPLNEELKSDFKDNYNIENTNNYNIEYFSIDNYGSNLRTNEIENKNEKYIFVKNLTKTYKNNFYFKSKNNNSIVLKDMNFYVKKGECFGLLGLNGAGKTTTFKCIIQEISYNN